MLDNVMRGDWGNQKPQKWTKTFKTKKTSTQRNKKVEMEKFYPRTKQADNGTETKTCSLGSRL